MKDFMIVFSVAVIGLVMVATIIYVKRNDTRQTSMAIKTCDPYVVRASSYEEEDGSVYAVCGDGSIRRIEGMK